jgi:hypothetical protein
MDLFSTKDQSDPHSQRVMADAVEWRVRLERFAEMRAQLDADAADLVPQRSPRRMAQAFVTPIVKEILGLPGRVAARLILSSAKCWRRPWTTWYSFR